jgi:hypothetical protein
MAKELWAELGLENIISEAIVVEHLLRLPDKSIPSFERITLKETISVAKKKTH